MKMLQRNGSPTFTTESSRIDNEAAVWRIAKEPEVDELSSMNDRVGMKIRHSPIYNNDRVGINTCVSYGERVRIQNQYPEKNNLVRRRDWGFHDPGSAKFSPSVNSDFDVWRITDLSGGGNGCISYCDQVLLVNEAFGGHDGREQYMLQRDGTPKFTETTNQDRIDNLAAVWTIKDTNRECPTRAAGGAPGSHTAMAAEKQGDAPEQQGRESTLLGARAAAAMGTAAGACFAALTAAVLFIMRRRDSDSNGDATLPTCDHLYTDV